MADSPFNHGIQATISSLLTRLQSAPIAMTRQTRTPIHAMGTREHPIQGLGMPHGMHGYYQPSSTGPVIALATDSYPQSNYDDPLTYANKMGELISHEQFHAAQDSDPTLRKATDTALAAPAIRNVYDMFTTGNTAYRPAEAKIEVPAFLASDTLMPMGYGPAIAAQAGRPEVDAPSMIQAAKAALMQYLLPQHKKLVRK